MDDGSPTDATTSDLAEVVLTTPASLYTQVRRNDIERRKLGMSTWAQDLVLRTLIERGPLRTSDLADVTHVATPTMTIALRRLEHRGLVRRSDPLRDKRTVLIEISERGLATYRDSMASFLQAMEQRLIGLDPDDRQALGDGVRVLERLIGGVNK